LQVIFFISWSLSEESKLSNPKAKTILLETMPVDPRDYLSGNYFTLSYAIRMSGKFQENRKNRNFGNKSIFAVLKKQGNYYVPDYISLDKPEKVRGDQAVIKGQMNGWDISYGIEKYFINENTKTPARSDKVDVLVNVDEDGSVRIIKLYVNDREFNQN